MAHDDTVTEGPVALVPDLEFEAPYCSRCGEQTIPEDGYYCPECGAMWGWDGTHGERPAEGAGR